MIPTKDISSLIKAVGGLRTPVLIFLAFCVALGAGVFVWQEKSGCPDLEVWVTTNETRLLADCELIAVAFNTRAEGWTRDERVRSQRAHYRLDMIQGDSYAHLLRDVLPFPKKWKTPLES